MSQNDLPWYLKDTPFFFITLSFSPLAFILLLVYWKRLDVETRWERIVFASIFLLLFSISLLPYNLFRIWLGAAIFVLFYAMLSAILVKK